MDGVGGYHAERNDTTYMWILKKTGKYNKKKQTHRCRRQSSGYQWKEGRRERQKRCRELRGANHYA